MNISYSLDQYADTCRDAIKKSSAKLNESFENLLVEILLLYMIIGSSDISSDATVMLCIQRLMLKHLSFMKPYSSHFITLILLFISSFFQLRCGNRTMQAFRRSRVGYSTSFTTVHSSFINVHHTFILVQKTGMKKTVKQTSDVMSYDYAPSCRTTIGAHVVRSQQLMSYDMTTS